MRLVIIHGVPSYSLRAVQITVSRISCPFERSKIESNHRGVLYHSRAFEVTPRVRCTLAQQFSLLRLHVSPAVTSLFVTKSPRYQVWRLNTHTHTRARVVPDTLRLPAASSFLLPCRSSRPLQPHRNDVVSLSRRLRLPPASL